MKKTIAKLFIALAVLGGIPNSGMAKTTSMTESAGTNAAGYYNQYRLDGRSKHTHRIYLGYGYHRIAISGDGDTDLDLYAYETRGLSAKSDGYGDDEIVVLNVNGPGYFTVEVVNRGKVYNDYTLIVE